MRSLTKSIAKGAVKASAITLVFCAVFSILMLYIDLQDKLITYITVALLGGMCYMTAYFSTQIMRSKGMLQGFLSGIIIFAITVLTSIIARKFQFTSLLFMKLIVCIVCGTFGGIKGINTKHTKAHK